MRKFAFFLSCLLVTSLPSLFAEEKASEDQAEEQESEPTSSDSAVKRFAGGVKQVAYEGPKDLVKETAEETPKKPIVGVVEGINKGTQKLLDHTVRGAYKVATLGTDELESYEVVEPEKGSGEPTKIKISLPGT